MVLTGDDRHIVFSLKSNPDNTFRIDNQTGLLQLAKTLDRETTASYTVVVQATDKVGVIVSFLHELHADI